jgi:glycosyltransferase involved in cell wall biosynthesis
VSGSILYCLQQGKVVLTSNVNAIAEIIEDGETGVILEGNIYNDTCKIDALFRDNIQAMHIQRQIGPYLLDNHSVEVVASYYRN